MANHVVFHQVFAKQLPGVGIADAEHGAEFCDGYHIRVEAETLFIILSCLVMIVLLFWLCMWRTMCAAAKRIYFRRQEIRQDDGCAYGARCKFVQC